MSAKLSVLPLNGMARSNAEIAAHLRQQAQWIEESEVPIRNAYLVVERADGTVYRQVCGEQCDLARAVGVTLIAIVRDFMEPPQ